MLLAACFVLAATGSAAELSPGEIVDAAIKATGGVEAIAKQKAVTWTENGTYYGTGSGLPYTAKYANELPNRFRLEIVNVFTIVYDGEKGWRKAMGNVVELDTDELAEQKESTYAGWITTLLPLKEKAKEFTLAAAGEGKVNDRRNRRRESVEQGTPRRDAVVRQGNASAGEDRIDDQIRGARRQGNEARNLAQRLRGSRES